MEPTDESQARLMVIGYPRSRNTCGTSSTTLPFFPFSNRNLLSRHRTMNWKMSVKSLHVGCVSVRGDSGWS